MLPRLSLSLRVVAVLSIAILAWQEHQQLQTDAPILRKATLLSQENDALRTALAKAQADAADAKNAVRRAQIERDTSAIRGLPFKNPVDYEVLDKAGIRQIVAGKISEIYTDQELKDVSTGLSALGLLPPNFPLKQTYINLLGEQIAAFYDQHQHKLFMFRDASLENSQNRVILSHELTHALQDQNFGLLKLPLEAKNDDDQALAASALIEGDATLEMTQYMQQDLSWKSLEDTVTYSATQSMVEIRKAPLYLRQMLVFPYLQGQQFCAAVYARGGFPALSAVYADPPTSTSQILHPEKYFKETRENPIPVEFSDTTFRDQKPLADNVLGEMGCRILFAQADADHADDIAAGWRGDRYLVFDQGRSLVWISLWSSHQAAHAAAGVVSRLCENRFPGVVIGGAGGIASMADSGPAWNVAEMWQPSDSVSNEVVFILAPDKESRDSLRQKFAGPFHG